MLKKLLKYEFKATSRGILPLYIALLVLAVMLKILVINNINIGPGFIADLIRILSVFLYGATMAAIAVATLLIIVQRFYKNLLGDEGYLMNTIPVSINQNIISKLITSIIWCCFSVLIACLSIFIVAANKEMLMNFFPDISRLLSEAFAQYGFNVPVIFFEGFIAGITQLALNIILIYVAISIGHMLPKMKILGSFAAYLGLVAAMSIVMTTAAKVCFSITSFNSLFNNLIQNSPINFTHIFLIACIVINVLWFTIFYMSTHYILKNRLNLE